MRGFRLRRVEDVHRILEGDLLIRPGAVKDGDRRAERLEVQKPERILDLVQEIRNGVSVNVWFPTLSRFWPGWPDTL